MSAKVHNSTALDALVLQPGSSFTRSRAGFDTGRRQFKCWAASAPELAPLRGDADYTFDGMLVDTVTISEMRGGLATVDVSYLGVLTGNPEDVKPDEFVYNTNYQESGDNVTFIVNGVTHAVDFGYHLPQVTHTYVTEDLPTTKPGQLIAPGKYADLVPDGIIVFDDGMIITPVNPVAFWRLDGRNIREVNGLYELSDTYNYNFMASSYTVTYP